MLGRSAGRAGSWLGVWERKKRNSRKGGNRGMGYEGAGAEE